MGELPYIIVGLPSRGMWPVVFEQSLMGALLGNNYVFRASKTYANWHITDDARNSFACTAIREKADYLFMTDTDMIFPKSCLALMLKHIQKFTEPVILGGIYAGRSDDHRWHVYEKTSDTEWKSLAFPLQAGLKRVDIVGTGCMLIPTEVFRIIDMPWFEYKYLDLNPDPEEPSYRRMSEDFVFCDKVRKANIPIFADTDIICGHLHATQIWPTEDGSFEVKTLAGEVY